MVLKLTPAQLAALMAKTHCARDTIKKYPNVSNASLLRIEDGLKALGLSLPTTEADQAA